LRLLHAAAAHARGLLQISQQDALMDQSLDQILGGVMMLIIFPAFFARRSCPPTLEQVRKLKAIAVDISMEVKTQGECHSRCWLSFCVRGSVCLRIMLPLRAILNLFAEQM